MAFILRAARTRVSSEDEPSAGPADQRSGPSAVGDAGKADELSAKSKLLTELEKPTGARPTKMSEPPPLSATRLADLDADIRSITSNNMQLSLSKRTARGLVRFLIIFSVGVGSTLAWQGYGDEIRELITTSYPQLGWLAPQAAVAKTAPEIVPAAPATASPERRELETLSISLAVMQQSINELTAQFAAGQQQMASDMATLKQDVIASQQQAASDLAKLKQNILAKLSSPPRPAAASAPKPVPVAPPPSQEPPER